MVLNPLFFFAESPLQPDISLHSKWEEAGRVKVFKGHRFAISCGYHSPYKVLSFRLKTAVYTEHPTEYIQSPVDGRAIFMFPAAEDAHQGTYWCDYNFDFSPEVFSEPSTISVTVKRKELAILAISEQQGGLFQLLSGGHGLQYIAYD